MTKFRIRTVLALGCVAPVLLVSGPAFAYIDPGTGSMILQIILAGIAGAGLVATTCWTRIKLFFGLPREKTGNKVDQ